MDVERGDNSGLALGAWGAVQATATGIGIALGGFIRDVVGALAAHGALGPRLPAASPAIRSCTTSRSRLLFVALVAIGPLVRTAAVRHASDPALRPGRVSRLIVSSAEVVVMSTGAITSHIDVAQVVLYAFWIFFAGLIIYIRREDKREGYPLESDRSGSIKVQGFPAMPEPKSYRLPHGGTRAQAQTRVAGPRARSSRCRPNSGRARRSARPATRCAMASGPPPTRCARTRPT